MKKHLPKILTVLFILFSLSDVISDFYKTEFVNNKGLETTKAIAELCDNFGTEHFVSMEQFYSDLLFETTVVDSLITNVYLSADQNYFIRGEIFLTEKLPVEIEIQCSEKFARKIIDENIYSAALALNFDEVKIDQEFETLEGIDGEKYLIKSGKKVLVKGRLSDLTKINRI